MAPKISSIRNANNINLDANTLPAETNSPRKSPNYAAPTSTKKIMNESFKPLSKEDQKVLREALNARKLGTDAFESTVINAAKQASRNI